MSAERHVKLIRDGDHQSIRIPAGFELPGEEAVIRREGSRLVLEPIEAAPRESLVEWLKTIEPWDGEFPEIEDCYPEAPRAETSRDQST